MPNGTDATTIDLPNTGIRIPVWSVVTGVITIVVFTIGIVAIVYNMKDSIKSNIDQNNINQNQQLVTLKKIVCYQRWQIQKLDDPSIKSTYVLYQCEKE